MKVLIDDEKLDLPGGSMPDLIARNLQAGILLLVSLAAVGEFENIELYLDHDLGEADELMTGRKVMEWIKTVNSRISGDVKPKKIVCVSSNSYGRQIIEDDVRILYGRVFRS